VVVDLVVLVWLVELAHLEILELVMPVILLGLDQEVLGVLEQ
jgi:hypothetical protein